MDIFKEFLEQIQELPVPENYTPQDRYNDFRQVFMGTEQGKRVYRELLSWGKLFSAPFPGNPIDPYKLAIIYSEHNFAVRLMAAVNIEPPKQVRRTHGRSSRKTS